MFTFLEQRLGKLKEIVGLDIRLLGEEKYETNWVHIKEDKGSVQIISSYSNTIGLDELKEVLPKNVPIALTIDGKGILHKKVEGGPTKDLNVLLERAFPNGKLSDFYIQQYPGSGGTWVSIIRKQFLEEFLTKLLKINIQPIQISFGFYSLVNATLSLNPNSTSIAGPFGYYQIKINNRLLESFEPNIESKELEFQQITAVPLTHQNALAFSVAFQHFLPKQVFSNIQQIKEYAKEAIHKVIFEKLGWGIMIFFLAILLINFFVFQHFTSQNQEFKQKESLFSGNLDDLAKLNKSIQEKEGFLEKTGWKSASKLSYYSDKIASTVPNGILLSTLELYPVNFATINSKKEIKINTQQIKIKGNCSNPSILNNWVLQLKYFDWIETIKVIDYQFDGTKKTSAFTLQLELN